MYPISSISNRDVQLLYQYRILRQPADYLTAIIRQTEPVSTTIKNWVASSVSLEGYTQIYESFLDIPLAAGIPFLEFLPKPGTEIWLADLLYLDIQDNRLILYSASDNLSNLDLKIYWTASLSDIETVLTQMQDAIDSLNQNSETLKDTLRTLSDKPRQSISGVIPNLLQIDDSDLGIADSGYDIVQAESERLFVDLSQSELNSMVHTFNTSVEFRFLKAETHTLENMTAPLFKISGYGTLVLSNLIGMITLTDWHGSVTILDCPDVHIQANSSDNICILQQLCISRNSNVYLENYTHSIDTVSLLLNSTLRHWRGYIRNLDWVGYGCTYWCSEYIWVPGINFFDVSDKTQNTVYDFNTQKILGTFIKDNNQLLIHAGNAIGFHASNSDCPNQPEYINLAWSAEYES